MGRKGAHRSALSLDSSLGNMTALPKTEKGKSWAASDEIYSNVRIQAQQTLNSALRNASFSQVSVYRNSLGHNILAEREEYRSRFNDLEAQMHIRLTRQDEKIVRQNEKIVQLGGVIDDLRSEVKQLKVASEDYRLIRSRYLDIYKRDILKVPTAALTETINDGNKAAHRGDAVTDASLYEMNIRNDPALIRRIYGLIFAQILELSRAGDYRSISILNARATLKSNREREIPQEIEKAWETYIFLLETYWGETPENPVSALGQGYFNFWKVHKQHK